MKRVILLLLVITALTISVRGWADCTPASCSTGYTNNGVYCTGGTCYRNCTIPICTTTWTQVHTSNCGWNALNSDENNCEASGYTTSNNLVCYKFTYDGPAADSNNIFMNVDDSGENCDSEAIGGFWDTTNADHSNPWFSTMSNYTGTPGDPEYDYLLKIMRAHTDADSDDAYMNAVSAYGEIYCAPNSVRACLDFGGTTNCRNTCYGQTTELLTHQGYYQKQATPDQTLYSDLECGSSYVSNNRIQNTNTFTVYSAPTEISNNDKNCDRINEASSVSNVLILPANATAGQDLNCNYTYYDIEGYAEQGSSYEWWKNNVNQDINDSTLNKGNLTPEDSWFCRVAPGDGLNISASQQQSNTISIRSTVQNVTLFVGTAPLWSYNSYFAGPKLILNMTNALNNELDSCVADAEGYCTVDITFSSTAAGNLSLSRLGIYYEDFSASESSARTAIEQGINTSNITNYSLFSDYQIYARYVNGTQKLGRFDKMVMAGNQAWAFNYVNLTESFTRLSSLANNTLVVWENQTLTETQIISQVSGLINRTKW